MQWAITLISVCSCELISKKRAPLAALMWLKSGAGVVSVAPVCAEVEVAVVVGWATEAFFPFRAWSASTAAPTNSAISPTTMTHVRAFTRGHVTPHATSEPVSPRAVSDPYAARDQRTRVSASRVCGGTVRSACYFKQSTKTSRKLDRPDWFPSVACQPFSPLGRLPVSTPLRWDELTEDVTPRRFGMREALERVEQHGDLFAPVLAGGQALGRALKQVR